MRPAPVVAAALAIALAGCGVASTPPTGTGPRPLTTTAVAPTPPARTTAELDRGDPVAHVVRRTALRTRPGGRVVATIGPRTRWGTPRYLPVVRRRGDWLGVIVAERPNGRLGWLRAGATRSAVARTSIVVDLSARRLRLLDDRGRALMTMTVAVGAPATPTPTGRFAVTDGLRAAAGSPYGCCILALSGHQPNVPQGWTGGDRLAVHGTDAPSSIGQAASSGCLRASDADVRRLMRSTGLGTVVRIEP